MPDPAGLPPRFEYRQGRLWLEGVALNEVAARYGTPAYVYSAGALRAAFQRYQAAFAGAGLQAEICYAVKANSNLAVLKLLAGLGAGADVVSGGELERAFLAGIPVARIVFAGVGKTVPEIDLALQRGIRAFQVESAGELDLTERRAAALGRVAPVSLRVNPDVEVATHPYISTGSHLNKFGLSVAEVYELARQVVASPYLRLCGLQMHIGSQLLEVGPIAQAFSRLLVLAARIEGETGQLLDYLDVGGGLGVPYEGEAAASPDALASALAAELASHRQAGGRAYPLLAEPGRYIVAQAGALLTSLLYLKPGEGVNFAIVDAGMNDLLRPALYQATHRVVPLQMPTATAPATEYEVVGPVCESGDWLAHAVPLVGVQPGDRLAVLNAGAYGFTMASNYNSRLRPPEILVDGNTARLVRRRETYADLLAAETDLAED